MKISKKEKLLLVMMVSLLLGVLYYQFIYTPQTEQIQNLESQKNEKQAEYDTLLETIRTLEDRKTQIETYYSTIQIHSSPFYPTLLQEKLILELDKLLADHSIEGNISFTQATAEPVQSFGETSVTNPQSSLQQNVDIVNGVGGTTTDEQSTEDGTTSSETTTTTVEQMKISLSFNATYNNLKEFIKALQEYERQIVLTNISLTPGLNDAVSGSMNIEVYAFPKFEGIDFEYYMWPLDNTYGKETPFSGIGAAVGVDTIEGGETEVNAENDFVALVKSNTSELPTFMMGTALDSTESTYIKSYEKENEVVTITLTQNENLYYYQYSHSTQSYPDAGNTAIFTPAGQINIEITSEERVTIDDVFSVRFNVINQTDKTVNVTIKNDDKNNPRVVVSGEGNPVNVTKE